MPGTLFVVATPIGNLEDITLRALRVLREVDLIAAEDTRRTAKLLARHNIQRPLVSLHAYNEYREAPKLIERLAAGASIALVSDAGTPGISDPGEHLVRLARDRGLPVTPIPGPSAITAALSVSGFAASEFVFMGFPPRRGQDRESWMQRLATEERTVVMFEAPHRAKATIKDMASLVNKPMYVYRELSKIHEELVILPLNDRNIEFRNQGEFVIVIPPSAMAGSDQAVQATLSGTAAKMVGCMTVNGEFSVDEAIKLASRALHLDSRAVKKAFKAERIRQRRGQDSVS